MDIPKELADALAAARTDAVALRKIARLAVIASENDANSALEDGAVLVAIASTKDGEFRFLLGLPEGLKLERPSRYFT